MYTATFIFDKKQYDERFYILDAEIAEIAKETAGYLGEESWENNATGRICNVYYWQSLQALPAPMEHPKHLGAKAAQANWLDGYQVIIAEVIRSYGDGKIAHPAASFNAH